MFGHSAHHPILDHPNPVSPPASHPRPRHHSILNHPNPRSHPPSPAPTPTRPSRLRAHGASSTHTTCGARRPTDHAVMFGSFCSPAPRRRARAVWRARGFMIGANGNYDDDALDDALDDDDDDDGADDVVGSCSRRRRPRRRWRPSTAFVRPRFGCGIINVCHPRPRRWRRASRRRRQCATRPSSVRDLNLNSSAWIDRANRRASERARASDIGDGETDE